MAVFPAGVMMMKHFFSVLLVALLLPCAAFAEGEMILLDETGSLLVESTEARELTRGAQGDDVTELQQRLTELYYYSGAISGSYGENTQAAVKAFQEDFGLDATGTADAQTLALVYSTLYRPLQYGSSGEDVKRLQTRLTELGYYTGKISGNFLEATGSAIERFQQKIGEEPTGIADIDVQALLFSGDALSAHAKVEVTPTPAPDLDNMSFLVIDEDAPVTPTPIPVVEFKKQLARGSTGKTVKQLQERLTELGYYEGPVSGNFLGHTANAVKAFQKQNGLKADSIVGEDTWNMIFNTSDIILPDQTPRPTPTPTPVPFAITVDVNNQVTTVYGRDENGDYTVVIRQMLCSTGTKGAPSDVGDWVLSGRNARWCYFPKWGGHAQYWTKINGSIAFHSVIYNTVDTMDLSVKSYKNLGKRASHGCIRLTVADARWIYENVGKGTVVTITEKLPKDPELVASLKLPPLNYGNMLPKETPQPTAEPNYISGGQPPLPLTKLKKNDSSPAVYWMQKKLTELGYYQGKCSGTYLAGTASAVKAFQKANGLSVNGDVASVQMLEKLYEKELATPEPIPTPAAN
ncbi:MAG: peptidoglycan-binding protein [Clostridia bacterium]|nr:peptidoglycan-binding protein [Clostridia bacterium]